MTGKSARVEVHLGIIRRSIACARADAFAITATRSRDDEEQDERQEAFEGEGEDQAQRHEGHHRWHRTDPSCRAEAKETNPHVPAYLTGTRKMPKHLPDLIGFGDESEAIAFVGDYGSGWSKTAGALAWLRSM
jgi:hypothetical protein